MRTGSRRANTLPGSRASARQALAWRAPDRLASRIAALMLCAGVLAAAGAAQAQARTMAAGARAEASAAQAATCVVHSLPSFVEQGEFALEATVADVVEVECNPFVYGTGEEVEITASELFDRCAQSLTWYEPDPFKEVVGARSVDVPLDADGNATVALRAGPGCSPGESLVAVHMLQAPFESFATSFSVLPPGPTPEGVFAAPAVAVEDAHSSSVATVLEAEFHGAGEEPVRFGASELAARCRVAPRIRWIRMDGSKLEGTSEITGISLDNGGNAFVIVLGTSSCAEGTSLIEADLETSPFTTFTTAFTILPPQPTEEPAFTIEKLQQITGSGFTASPLTGLIGETVEYEIVIKNTAHVPETFSDFSDPHCDAGTVAGGPGSAALAPEASATYTCRHVLTSVGVYSNEATVTAATVGGAPLTQTSNKVVVEVPSEEALAVEKLQRIAGGAGNFTSAPLVAMIGETVEYQITVRNTGNVAMTLTTFSDPRCDPGTIAGGPGTIPLAPGSAAVYTCSHVITAAGPYFNEATVTGVSPSGAVLPVTSNRVVLEAPEAPEARTVQPPVPPSKPPGGRGVLGCKTPPPDVRGASGPKRGVFTVRIGAAGVAEVTVYLDGRKLKRLKHAQARGGRFTIRIDARRLRYGAHRLTVKGVMDESECGAIARSSVFVRPFTEKVELTG
jgi:hypothetical protein